MVVARMSVWKFKSGRREDAFDAIERIKANAQKTDGFMGHLFLMPQENPDSMTAISLWENEEAERSSMQGLFQEASRDLMEYIASPPDVMMYQVYSANVSDVKPQMAQPA